MRFDLAESGGGTEVRYDWDIQVGGLIAGVGQRVLTGVGKMLTGQFMKAMEKAIAGYLSWDYIRTGGMVVAPGDSLREHIIQSALELFREKGYRATTIQDVIGAAGCSNGAFYHHFASKEDLLLLIHDTFMTYQLERGFETVNKPGTAASKLRQVIVGLVDGIDLYRPHVTMFFEERRYLESEKFQLIKQKRNEYVGLVKGIVQDGMRYGELSSDLDPTTVTFSIFGMCNWTYQWMRPEGKLTPRQIGETMADLVLKGLLVSPNTSSAPGSLNE